MSDVFYLRPIAPPATPESVLGMATEAGNCFHLHRVTWRCSFLATDGGRMLCWYRAPDAESARLALKELGSDMNSVWAGTVLGDFDAEGSALPEVSTLAEISFAEPLPGSRKDMLQHLGYASLRDVSVAAGFLSNDRRRLVTLLQAPDADTASAALEALALPARSIWSCTVIVPPTAPLL